jgi:hypothetical protein
MDISKLPKLSKTDAPPPPSQPEATPPPTAEYRSAGAAYNDAHSAALPVAEAWIAAIVGLIFTYLGRRFGAYLISLIAHRPFHTDIIFATGPNEGQEVPYPQLEAHAMINDAGMFLFGLACLFDAIVIASVFLPGGVRKPLLWVALLATVAATIFNLYVAIVFFASGVLPLFSLLAVAIGGYTAVVQWIMLKQNAPSDGAIARG